MTAVLRTHDGDVIPLDVARWRDEASAAERRLLGSVADPVLDVGCGPGRIVESLAAAGRPALGIDSSIAVVAEARGRGAPVLCRSVFAPLPGEGRWRTVLLFDGNVGIGGNPAALLRRIRGLLSRDGVAVVEVDQPGGSTGPVSARIESSLGVGPWFPWARVAADHLPRLAAAAGFSEVGIERHGSRWFGRLRGRTTAATHSNQIPATLQARLRP